MSENSKNEPESHVVFSRSNMENQEDVWDDTALIRAYEKSVRKIKKAISSKLNVSEEDTSKSQQKQSAIVAKTQDEDLEEEDDTEDYEDENEEEEEENEESTGEFDWKVGDLCSSIFSQDGLLYPAKIIKIFNDKNNRAKCLIQYLYYLNEEEKYTDELYEYDANAETENDQKSEVEAKPEKIKKKNEAKSEAKFPEMPSLPVPPMPFEIMKYLNKNKQEANAATNEMNEEDALHSMLMSWYMSGYHTGFYFGLNCSKNSKSKNK